MDSYVKISVVFLVLHVVWSSINHHQIKKKLISFEDSEYDWQKYHNLSDINKFLNRMKHEYPQWVEIIVGGRSFEGRDILGLRINTPFSSQKPAIIIESGIHAAEWTAPASVTYFINQLLTSQDPEIQGLRDHFDWHIFPSVNPDGYHYTFAVDFMWRKTRSWRNGSKCYGVDANRNWDYKWGLPLNATSDPCSDRYFGPAPFSEIETRTLAQYIAGVKNLKVYLAFHADAQMLLVPYGDTTKHKENYDDLVKIGKVALEYGYKVNGTKYEGPGTAAELLYAASGSSADWVHSTLKVPIAYTFELQHWNWPNMFPAEKLPEQGDEVTQMILGLTVEAKKLGYL